MNAVAALALCQVFLVPGAFGPGSGGASRFITGEQYFAEFRQGFAARGCRVKIGEFPPDATIEERALILKDQVGRFREGKPVTLIAHSQGGLDARFALKNLKMDGVGELITIGTPHGGTPAADWVVSARDRGTPTYYLLRWLGDYDLKALRFAAELAPAFLEKHSAHFQPVEGVRYASARGVCRTGCHDALRFVQWWMGWSGPGDGLIPAESQRFGDDLGEYDLDHLSEVGTDPAKQKERLRFFDRIWAYLSAR